MTRIAAVLLLLAAGWAAVAHAADQPAQLGTLNQSILIAAGGTYQAVSGAGQPLKSLTIQNTNATDNCYLEVSGLVTPGMTTASAVTISGKPAATALKVSILLAPGQSYSRYYPFIPTGPIVATCQTTADWLYVDWQ